MEGFLFRQLTIEDKPLFADALELLNRTQGRDLFGPNYLEERTTSPTNYVVGALLNDKIVGIGVAGIISNYDFYLPFQAEINSELKHKKVGSFSTLCILEELQGKGLGQTLSKMRLDWLKSKECDVILGVSWVSGLAHTSNRVFEKMGFSPVRLVENFFHKMCIENPFDCPACSKDPCTCSAILYKKVL